MAWTFVGNTGSPCDTTGANVLYIFFDASVSSFVDNKGNTWTRFASDPGWSGHYLIGGIVGTGHNLSAGQAWASDTLPVFDAASAVASAFSPANATPNPVTPANSNSLVVAMALIGRTADGGYRYAVPSGTWAQSVSLDSYGGDFFTGYYDAYDGYGIYSDVQSSIAAVSPLWTGDADYVSTVTAVFGPGVSGTISRPGSDFVALGWTFTAASLAASINETTRDDASYGQAAFALSVAVTNITPTVAGSYTLSFAGQYLAAAASSGRFRFTALDGANNSLGATAWRAVTSAATQYDVPLTISGGTATRLKIEIQP